MDTVLDWRHEARTLILAGMGHRETARHLGLPEDRVRKWAEREQLGKARSLAVATIAKVSPNVATTTAGDVLQSELNRLGSEGRLSAARIGAGVLAHHASKLETEPEAVSARIDEAVGATRLMQNGNVPGWERAEQRAQVGAINIALFGLAAPEPIETARVELIETQQPVAIPDQDNT